MEQAYPQAGHCWEREQPLVTILVSKNNCITADNKHFCEVLLSDVRLEQIDAPFFFFFFFVLSVFRLPEIPYAKLISYWKSDWEIFE